MTLNILGNLRPSASLFFGTRFAQRVVLAAAALTLCGPPAHAGGDPLQIKTPAGKLEGKLDGQSHAFLGIPYAVPPVGDLRWKAPQPPVKWSGLRQAQTFGARCMQPPLYDDMFFRDPGNSEDCLTLNVWTPSTAKKNTKLPVMVWIYGGGYVTGGTSEPRQDGAHLAENGVIVVTVNYRLGIFGFFAHPGLAAESGHNSAGNYGLLDQVAGLAWVKKNIASFGGDPANVTIFGESAGSFSVSALMASPLAHGLFSKAIGESGGAFSAKTLPFESMEARAQKDAAFGTEKLGAATLAQLRAVPAEKLLSESEASIKSGARLFTPDTDGYFLPDTVGAIFAAGKQNDVPLLAGWNHDEGGSGKDPAGSHSTPGGTTVGGTATSGPAPSDLDRLKTLAQTEFSADPDGFLKAFPATTDAEALTRLQQVATDKFIAFGTWKWLEMQTQTGKRPAYRYRMDLVPPADPARPGRYGVFHSNDIEYVFGNIDSRKGITWRPEDYALSKQMQQYWTNFARTGDPNGAGLPQWPVYTPASGSQVMYLDAPPHAAQDDLRGQFLFLNEAWKK